MQTFALLVGGLIGLAMATLLFVSALTIRSRAKNARFASLINQTWVMVQAAVAHAEVELRPKKLVDGKLTPAGAASLKADVMRIAQEMAATQLEDLVKDFRLPELMASGLLSGLIERAVALLKTSPAPTVTAPPMAPAQ